MSVGRELDTWQTGQKRSKHKVVAERVQFLQRSAARAHRDDAAEATVGTQKPEYDSEVPF